ncbi:hypothetical protein C8Q77DRAFT_1165126 [Trametes polyzona]|nr:hypothetical protein C8Q77DRAFT_1165126 [Trametes polyzona]
MPSTRNALEELHLLKCSLLPGELLTFTEDSSEWETLLDAYAADPELEPPAVKYPARFEVRAEGEDTWFEVGFLEDYKEGSLMPSIAVKGDHLARAEQERWQSFIAEAMEEVRGSEYPLYELISTHLLPRLHEVSPKARAEGPPTSQVADGTPPRPSDTQSPSPASPRYHALFTSHHLKSPQKRRSLSQWSHELSLVGFAKVGHPGVIYCEGAREDVEDFVSRVKSMQWLALRLRFIEPAPENTGNERGRWAEFEKVGEVVEEMRRLGRERYVVEMGIGSAGTFTTSK